MKRKMEELNTTPKSSATGSRSSATVIENIPLPLTKDKKAMHKNPNAADKLRETHQPEWERQAARGPERCRQVDAHNKACPKLCDELDRRRSIAKPAANIVMQYTNGVQTTGWFNPRCRNCAKLEIERKQIKRRFEKRPPRIVKKKPQARKKIMLHKALSMVSEVVHIVSGEKPRCSKAGYSKDEEGKPSNPSLQYPSSHEPSVSSYHSFMSGCDEPMV